MSKIIHKGDNDKDKFREYQQFIEEREQRKMNFNRKNRWAQRELDDIMKNFDIKTAKFKDYAKIQVEDKIYNDKKFNSIEEVLFFIEDILSKSEFLSEEVVSNSLDVFIKYFNQVKAEDIQNKFRDSILLSKLK